MINVKSKLERQLEQAEAEIAEEAYQRLGAITALKGGVNLGTSTRLTAHAGAVVINRHGSERDYWQLAKIRGEKLRSLLQMLSLLIIVLFSAPLSAQLELVGGHYSIELNGRHDLNQLIEEDWRIVVVGSTVFGHPAEIKSPNIYSSIFKIKATRIAKGGGVTYYVDGDEYVAIHRRGGRVSRVEVKLKYSTLVFEPDREAILRAEK